MKDIAEFKGKLKFLLTDIDDTLTDEGLLHPKAFQALWDLKDSGVVVIPVTGRPAGWCEMIARQWPVGAVVGENGGFYFRYHQHKMKRSFIFDFETQIENRKKLDRLQEQILEQVPGCALASDQFCRLMDLAIDFCEDVPPLPPESVARIVALFEKAGAQAKVSSIHVNGWYGAYDKLTQSLNLLKKEYNLASEDEIQRSVGFIGDSPNDEPMFSYFSYSMAVANISHFVDQIKSRPKYVTKSKGGLGFTEAAQKIIKAL